jgi:hypothetical protein
MAGYLQLDREVLNSTVWVGTDSDTKALWFFLLLAADMRTGIVHHTLPAISRDTGIPREKIDSILIRFSSPDPDSRTKDNEGRRIKFIDLANPNGGILVLNYGKYRDKHLSQSADRMRRYRERRDVTNTRVTSRDATVTKEKEKEKEKELTPIPPSLEPEIRERESRYSPTRIRAARASCSLSRVGGKLADSTWLKVLIKFAEYPAAVVESAIDIFCDKNATGQYDEKYLLGIVRGEAKRAGNGAVAKPESTIAQRIELGYGPVSQAYTCWLECGRSYEKMGAKAVSQPIAQKYQREFEGYYEQHTER